MRECEFAAGVLRVLASTQATELNPSQDAEPGKIVHEIRQGEVAQLGEVPFRRYYGSIDATPLFVLLAAYFSNGPATASLSAQSGRTSCKRWNGSSIGATQMEMASSNMSAGRRRDSRSRDGKTAYDSVFHADGRLARGPIALCEVQGYVYAAKRAIAQVATTLGHTKLAHRLQTEAFNLRNHFQDAFWCDKIGCYALALDGEKRRCEVASSNAGHTLFTGIASNDHAQELRKLFLSEEFFSGWGVRTISNSQIR